MRRRSFVALIAAAAVPALAWPRQGGGAFRWQFEHPDFGGLSALHLWPDGLRFLALSDRGRFLQGDLTRDAAGRIVAADVARMGRLLGLGGQALKPRESDSEGVAVAADGTVYVSFEGPGGGRVWRYDRIDGPAKALPRPDAFKAMSLNGSLEALAIDAKGWLYALPEGAVAGGHALWRFDGDWAQIGVVPQRGAFLPVAADFGPDGRLYLLERRFVFPIGFASRLSVLHPGAWDRPETLWQSTLGEYDNLEGLSVTRGPKGLRATMVSDDNFMAVQRTELVEVDLA